jgi:hypothetical protein
MHIRQLAPNERFPRTSGTGIIAVLIRLISVIKYIANYPLSNNFQICSLWAFSMWAPPGREKLLSGEMHMIISLRMDQLPHIDADGSPCSRLRIGVRSQLMGYFIRADWAWGIENNQWLPRIFYFSMGLDF